MGDLGCDSLQSRWPADGIKSIIRSRLLGDSSDNSISTGDAAYRILLPRRAMESDPDLEELVDEPQATRWLGPSRHIIAYPIRAVEQAHSGER